MTRSARLARNITADREKIQGEELQIIKQEGDQVHVLWDKSLLEQAGEVMDYGQPDDETGQPPLVVDEIKLAEIVDEYFEPVGLKYAWDWYGTTLNYDLPEGMIVIVLEPNE